MMYFARAPLGDYKVRDHSPLFLPEFHVCAAFFFLFSLENIRIADPSNSQLAWDQDDSNDCGLWNCQMCTDCNCRSNDSFPPIVSYFQDISWILLSVLISGIIVLSQTITVIIIQKIRSLNQSWRSVTWIPAHPGWYINLQIDCVQKCSVKTGRKEVKKAGLQSRRFKPY